MRIQYHVVYKSYYSKSVRVALKYFCVFVMGGLMLACGASEDASSANGVAKQQQVSDSHDKKDARSSSAIEGLFNRSCVSCHLSGVAGAPRKGDVNTWQRRVDTKGMEVLVANVRKGLGAMPPMGMCNDCSDADFKALIEWMAQPATQ